MRELAADLSKFAKQELSATGRDYIMSKTFTEKDVEAHNKDDDCWLIIGNPGEKKVYDVTKFLEDHPGGPEILTDVGGKDANDEFEDIGHSEDARDDMKNYLVGSLKEDPEKVAAAKAKALADAEAKAKGGNGMMMAIIVIIIGVVVAYTQMS